MSLSNLTTILWDADDDPLGNVQHIAKHGVTKQEVVEVFDNPVDIDTSWSTGELVVFGDTAAGRHLMIVYEMSDEVTAYPITAYDVARRKLI